MSEISVIVPVYKAQSYLHRCVDSILAQTFSNFDLILVDDGSPDDCPGICDGYAQKDTRVHVIHQTNSGPSIARNNGLDWVFEHSNSKYLAFVDSDDCIHPQYLERLYHAAVSCGTEISMCRHQYIAFSGTLETMTAHDECQVTTLFAEDLMIAEWSSFNYAWGKLYAKHCFRELRYPVDVSFGEDNLIIFKAIFECGKIAFVDDSLYYYFYNANGITKSPWTPHSLECFEGIRTQLNYYHENGYQKAYHKEIELYIQQCAYQIHRIRENKEDLQQNKPHLLALQSQMSTLFRENPSFRPQDVFYWYEALYPRKASIRNLPVRLRRNIAKNGFLGTCRKMSKKLKQSLIG